MARASDDVLENTRRRGELEVVDGNRVSAERRRLQARLSKPLRQITAKLEQWDSVGEDEPDAGKRSRLHRWLPALIVFASLAAATMGWQASVAEERATTKDELSRQDLVVAQQVGLQKIQQVDSDIRLFGQAEQQANLAAALRIEARYAGGASKHLLDTQGAGARRVAFWLAGQIRDPAAVSTKSGLRYEVGDALRSSRSGDPVLTSLEPGTLRTEAQKQRTRGLHLIGLAVLFIVALMFFTFAAVTSGRRSDAEATAARRGVAIVRWFTGPDAAAHGFAACGALASLAAIALFPIVRWMS